MKQIVFKGSPPPIGYDVWPIVFQLVQYGEVVLFGSFSRGGPARDLDFLLISDVDSVDLDNFGIKVDLKLCTREKLEKCLKLRDHVYKKAWERGIHYLK